MAERASVNVIRSRVQSLNQAVERLGYKTRFGFNTYFRDYGKGYALTYSDGQNMGYNNETDIMKAGEMASTIDAMTRMINKLDREQPQRTIRIAAYKYPELDQKAKAKVAEWLSAQSDVWEDSKDLWMEELKNAGFTDIQFAYSGFYSQGDGSWLACSMKVNDFIVKQPTRRMAYAKLHTAVNDIDPSLEIHVSINRGNHYTNDSAMYADVEELLRVLDNNIMSGEYKDAIMALATKLGTDFLNDAKTWAKTIYRDLQQMYESRFEESYVSERCEASEYLFDKYGEPIHYMEIK